MNAGSRVVKSWVSAALLVSLAACAVPADDDPADDEATAEDLVNQYSVFRLEADLAHLSENDRQVVRLLLEAVQPMDDIFWREAYGDKEEALALAHGDEATRRYIEINYGPWDRLHADGPFIDGIADKPAGANFYPDDMTAEEFEARRRRERSAPPRSTPWCGGARTARWSRNPITRSSRTNTRPRRRSCGRRPRWRATPGWRSISSCVPTPSSPTTIN